MRIVEQLKHLESLRDVTVVTKSGKYLDIERSSMNLNEMMRYRNTIISNLEEVKKDLELLSVEE